MSKSNCRYLFKDGLSVRSDYDYYTSTLSNYMKNKILDNNHNDIKPYLYPVSLGCDSQFKLFNDLKYFRNQCILNDPQLILVIEREAIKVLNFVILSNYLLSSKRLFQSYRQVIFF